MSFEPLVLKKAKILLDSEEFKFSFVPVEKMFLHLRLHSSTKVQGMPERIPTAFFLFLRNYGLRGKTRKHFEDFLKRTPKSLEKLKKLFFFELVSCCKGLNRRTNHQVFLFHLVHKFSGTTARSRTVLTDSFLDLSSSTFYSKQKLIAQDWVDFLASGLGDSSFFCWVDNFTKIRRVDWLANFEGKNFQIHDLTVACLFKPVGRVSKKLYQEVFLVQNELAFHSLKIFDQFAELLFDFPSSWETSCSYSTLEGLVF